MFTLALILALGIGLVLGFLGSGGSIVTLPVLVHIAGIEPHQAIPVSLAVVGGVSLLGAFLHWRHGNSDLRATALFALAGIPGALLGAQGTAFVPGPVLMLLFAGLMIAVGVVMLRRPAVAGKSHGARTSRCLAAGFLVGVLTGFLGVGGGFLIVPALMLFAGLEPQKAVGSSLPVIAVNCLAGLAGQLRGNALNIQLTAMFLGMAFAGMLVGVRVATRMRATCLSRVFAVFLLATAAVVAFVNGSKL